MSTMSIQRASWFWFHQAGNVNAFLTTNSGTPSSFPNNLLQYQTEVSVKSRRMAVTSNCVNENEFFFQLEPREKTRTYPIPCLIFRKEGFKEDWQRTQYYLWCQYKAISCKEQGLLHFGAEIKYKSDRNTVDLRLLMTLQIQWRKLQIRWLP